MNELEFCLASIPSADYLRGCLSRNIVNRDVIKRLIALAKIKEEISRREKESDQS
jgi:hypothetical protein